MKTSIKNNNTAINRIVTIFTIFQISNLLIIYNAGHFIDSANTFRFILYGNFLRFFANFDGIHYHNIVTQGYGLYEQAFFPFYPVLIKVLSFLFHTNSYFLVGLLISNISFLLFLIFFYKLLEQYFGEKKAFIALLFLALFPTSFFFVAYYTEGLFSLLFILTLYLLNKEKYLSAGIFAFLCANTRFIGVFILIPILVFFFFQKSRLTFRKFILLISPILGLFSYSYYLYLTKRDFLLFLHLQPLFGANRSADIITLPQVYYRYFKILTTVDFGFKYFVALSEFVIITAFLLVLLFQLYKVLKNRKKNRHEKSFSFLLGLNLFSLANLILPTLSGTFSSIPRYALLSFGFFIAIASIRSKYTIILLGILFLIFHIILLIFFTQGYFVS